MAAIPSKEFLGSKALVIGAGMGGMAAAAALRETFKEVILFDRDSLPAEAAPRSGTPQGLHGHVLLTGGLAALCDLFPGFDLELVENGAETIRVGLDFRMEVGPFVPFPQRDLGWDFYAGSRALYEHVVRQKLAKLSNVTIRSDVRVEEILSSDDFATVTGLRVINSEGQQELVGADLIVDASSHAMPTLKLLDTQGKDRPVEDLISVDLGYSSAMFERPEGKRDFKMMLTAPAPPLVSKSALLLPIEKNRWMVTLIGRGDEIPPGDWPGFMTFVDSLRTPSLKSALKDAQPVGKVWRYRFAANIRRRFERMPQLPDNLLPFGDVICRTNPAAGQGMSVAASEARELRDLLKARKAAGAGLEGLSSDFIKASQQYIDHAWALIAAQDFLFPGTKGDKEFAAYSSQIFNPTLFKFASQSPELHKLWQQVAHLVMPMSILKDAIQDLEISEMERSTADLAS